MYAGACSEIDGGYLMRAGELMVCYDPSSQKLVPLCSKAECDHQAVTSGADSCAAAILADSCLRIGVYKGKIWYLKGISPEKTVLCTADLTGENAKELYDLDVGVTTGSQAVLYKDEMYLVDAKPGYDEYGQYTGSNLRLVSIDLSNGEQTEIEGLEEAQAYSYEIIGMWDGKIYYCYCPDDTKYPDGAVVYYDCETGEKGETDLRSGILYMAKMNGEYLGCVKTDEKTGRRCLIIFDLADGEEQGRIALNGQVNYDMFKDEILIRDDGRYYRYIYETGECEAVENEKLADVFWPLWCTGDGYLGMQVEHGVTTEYAYMDRENFNYGGESVPLTEGGVCIW